MARTISEFFDDEFSRASASMKALASGGSLREVVTFCTRLTLYRKNGTTCAYLQLLSSCRYGVKLVVPLVPILGKMMAKAPRENRVPIMMADGELEAIDNWRFENHVATRSEAVRRLCRIAVILDAEMDRLTSEAFQVNLGFSELLERLIAVRNTEPEGSDRFDPVFEVVLPMIDAIYSLVTGIEGAAGIAFPFRSEKDLQAALIAAAEAKVTASMWRHRFEEESGGHETLSEFLDRQLSTGSARGNDK